jgi:hypothetical protein
VTDAASLMVYDGYQARDRPHFGQKTSSTIFGDPQNLQVTAKARRSISRRCSFLLIAEY